MKTYNNILKKLKMMVIVLVLLILLSNLSYSDDSSENWPDSWAENYVENPWWTSDEAADDFSDYEEAARQGLNWYPVADWEKGVCAETFSSSFYYDNQGITQLEYDDKVYDLTITLNAELQETSYTDENGHSQYSLTVGWYIQGIPQGNADDNKVEYKILLKPGSDYVNLGDGDTEKEFTIMTGTSGFYSNYTINEYDTAELIIDSNSYDFEIDKLDEGGEPI